MKVRVIRKCKISGQTYYPSPEILEVWPSEARKLIITGDLEDIEGNFIAAMNARNAYKKKIEKRKVRKENNDGDNHGTV